MWRWPELLWAALSRRRPGRGLALGAAALLVALALGVPATGQALLATLEGGLPTRPPADAPPQAIVILSAEVEHTTEGLEPGPLTLQRLLAGARLWHRTHLPVVVSGGVLGSGEEPVAAVMARTLERDFGVPVRWIEDRSRTTWENAADSAAMLRPEGISAVYVVTHAWHEPRAGPRISSFRDAADRLLGAAGRAGPRLAAHRRRLVAQLPRAA